MTDPSEPSSRPAAESDRSRPGRLLGVDLGSVRIGIAVSDSAGVLASPRDPVTRSGDDARDHARIFDVAREEGCARVVVGIPTSLTGKPGPAELQIREEVARMRAEAGEEFEIVTHDERFTTTIAHQRYREAGVRARDRKEKIDGAAAAVMLQGYLESIR